MLYLKLFFEMIHKNRMNGGAFIIISFMILSASLRTDFFEGEFKKLVKTNFGNPYFYALLDSSENSRRIGRKLKELPGVSSVSYFSESKVSSQLKEMMNNLNLSEVTKEYVDLGLSGIKVVFAKGLHNRSEQLIKSYLTRLVGSGKLLIGTTKYGENIKGTQRKVLTIIEKYGFLFLMSILFIFWMIITASFLGSVKREGYLIEQFRRLKRVNIKVMMAGFILISFSSFAPFLFVFEFHYFYLVVLFAMSLWMTLIQLKRFQWFD